MLLDSTQVHPEQYPLAESLISALGLNLRGLGGAPFQAKVVIIALPLVR